MLFGIVDAGLEALGLLLVGDVEEELEDGDAVVGEGLLPGVDIVHVLAGGFVAHESMDARGKDVFVVRAVEDADHASRWNLKLAAPEEVVFGFKRGRDFEAGDVAALGVNAGENMGDGAVFAGGIHALKDDEEGLGAGGIEDVLKDGEASAVGSEEGFGGGFVGEAVVVIGGEVRELNLSVGLDEVGGF
jgi:hypothetical protein